MFADLAWFGWTAVGAAIGVAVIVFLGCFVLCLLAWPFVVIWEALPKRPPVARPEPIKPTWIGELSERHPGYGLALFIFIFLMMFFVSHFANADDRHPVLSQIFPTLIPPVEYDHPFMGVVIVTRLDREALVKRCVIPNAWGCAHHYGPTCEVTIGIDDILVMPLTNIRVPWQAVYRHEIAHCNGWPWFHPYVATVKREELPPITVGPIPTKPVPLSITRILGDDLVARFHEYAARRAKELGLP
jgi:hypothetical protein